MFGLRHQDQLKPNLRVLLEQKLQKLRTIRPISPVALQKLKDRFQVEMAYNSNAIEGNTLTLNETYWVFQEGITIKGKSLKEHLEVKDHKKALEKLYQLIEEPTDIEMSEYLIKDLHHSVIEFSEESDDQGFRETDVRISGTNHKPSSPATVSTEMKELIQFAKNEESRFHPIEFAALFHHRFVHIHPFLDGNGRTARLLMNLFLMRKGYPLVVILKNDRQKYYRCLRSADSGRYKSLIQFIAQSALRSLNMYLDTLLPAAKKEELIVLAEATKYCSYSQEYLSKLAKEGRLDAHKQNRNWVTTKAAIEDYIKQHAYETAENHP